MIKSVHLFDWQSIESVPRRDADLRLVSLDPTLPELAIFEKKISGCFRIIEIRFSQQCFSKEKYLVLFVLMAEIQRSGITTAIQQSNLCINIIKIFLDATKNADSK